MFLLGSERIAPPDGRCHLYSLLEESHKAGRELTREFYHRYAEMRQDAFAQLARDNPAQSRHDVLAATQKLLDRVLFCAFCEDRSLLPGLSNHAVDERLARQCRTVTAMVRRGYRVRRGPHRSASRGTKPKRVGVATKLKQAKQW